ncbi:MAG: ferritin-like domain-containing protein [Gemmatimonadaceae bacterium]|nr:ferritin-like domain-containing protein [Gemmatimonadaceae bacterium]
MNEHQPILESIDPEVTSELVTRRDALSRGITFGSAALTGLKIATVPLALASLATSARAQSVTSIIGVLNFALTLEYLEDEFYRTGLARPVAAAFSPAERSAILQISMHETSHVNFLKAAISGLQGTPVAKPTFDFTARGTFPDVFTNKATFMAIAQTFEDTGVRAYKGQAGAVASNAGVLTAALQIHSVEARHASQIRRLRGQKGWITNADRGDLPASSQPTYVGEENTTHNGVNAASLGANVGGTAAVTEAFDEPLTMAQVLAIAAPFIV